MWTHRLLCWLACSLFQYTLRVDFEMPYILALDEGTTSCRAVIFDEAGSVRRIAQQEFEQHYPQPGWVEHDADEIWSAQLRVAREVIEKTGLHTRVEQTGLHTCVEQKGSTRGKKNRRKKFSDDWTHHIISGKHA